MFFWVKFHIVATKKNPLWIVQMIFWGKKERKKLLYLENTSHIYLDNEILSVAKTRQDSKKIIFDCLTCSQIWLIVLVDDRQSIYLTISKKHPQIERWHSHV